jgi:hypothetical protein
MAVNSLIQIAQVFAEDSNPQMGVWWPLAFGWVLSHLYMVTLRAPALHYVKLLEEEN